MIPSAKSKRQREDDGTASAFESANTLPKIPVSVDLASPPHIRIATPAGLRNWNRSKSAVKTAKVKLTPELGASDCFTVGVRFQLAVDATAVSKKSGYLPAVGPTEAD